MCARNVASLMGLAALCRFCANALNESAMTSRATIEDSWTLFMSRRFSLSLSFYQCHRFGTRARVFTKTAEHGRGDRHRSRLLHASQRHASVLSFYDNHHAQRL